MPVLPDGTVISEEEARRREQEYAEMIAQVGGASIPTSGTVGGTNFSFAPSFTGGYPGGKLSLGWDPVPDLSADVTFDTSVGFPFVSGYDVAASGMANVDDAALGLTAGVENVPGSLKANPYMQADVSGLGFDLSAGTNVPSLATFSAGDLKDEGYSLDLSKMSGGPTQFSFEQQLMGLPSGGGVNLNLGTSRGGGGGVTFRGTPSDLGTLGRRAWSGVKDLFSPISTAGATEYQDDMYPGMVDDLNAWAGGLEQSIPGVSPNQRYGDWSGFLGGMTGPRPDLVPGLPPGTISDAPWERPPSQYGVNFQEIGQTVDAVPAVAVEPTFVEDESAWGAGMAEVSTPGSAFFGDSGGVDAPFDFADTSRTQAQIADVTRHAGLTFGVPVWTGTGLTDLATYLPSQPIREMIRDQRDTIGDFLGDETTTGKLQDLINNQIAIDIKSKNRKTDLTSRLKNFNEYVDNPNVVYDQDSLTAMTDLAKLGHYKTEGEVRDAIAEVKTGVDSFKDFSKIAEKTVAREANIEAIIEKAATEPKGAIERAIEKAKPAAPAGPSAADIERNKQAAIDARKAEDARQAAINAQMAQEAAARQQQQEAARQAQIAIDNAAALARQEENIVRQANRIFGSRAWDEQNLDPAQQAIMSHYQDLMATGIFDGGGQGAEGGRSPGAAIDVSAARGEGAF